MKVMNNNSIKNELIPAMGLENHTEKCIALFGKCLDVFTKAEKEYQPTASRPNEKIACAMEEYDNHNYSLNCITYPHIGFGKNLLDKNDALFFKEPHFFPYQDQESVIEEMAKKYDIEEDLYFDDIIVYIDEIVKEWLAACWQKANQAKQIKHPMYLFSHNGSGLRHTFNLLNQQYYNLEETN